jgi:hypothetical protein
MRRADNVVSLRTNMRRASDGRWLGLGIAAYTAQAITFAFLETAKRTQRAGHRQRVERGSTKNLHVDHDVAFSKVESGRRGDLV